RRGFLGNSSVGAVGALVATQLPATPSALSADTDQPHQAMGIKVGEVTDTTAIVWTRLTRFPIRNNAGIVLKGPLEKSDPSSVTVPVEELEGACPGAPGLVRVRYATRADLSDAQETAWVEVGAQTDFIHQFALKGLKPATVYYIVTDSTGPGG